MKRDLQSTDERGRTRSSLHTSQIQIPIQVCPGRLRSQRYPKRCKLWGTREVWILLEARPIRYSLDSLVYFWLISTWIQVWRISIWLLTELCVLDLSQCLNGKCDESMLTIAQHGLIVLHMRWCLASHPFTQLFITDIQYIENQHLNKK